MKSLYFIFCRSELLLRCLPDGRFTIPRCDTLPVEKPDGTSIIEAGAMPDGTAAFAVDITDAARPNIIDTPSGVAEHVLMGLREAYYHLTPEHYRMAGKCSELLYWDRNARFCGACGAPMEHTTAISKRCTRCGKEIWPSPAPSVIVRICRGDEVLLVHAHNFKTPFYGLIAGFVETGETLEEAVRREVMEETGLTITNLRYFMSQPWPYPCGLMVGFTADYLSGELHLQSSELAYGGWFRYDHLPRIPQKLSIARMLIDDWLRTYGITSEQD